MPGYSVSTSRQYDLDSSLLIYYPGTWGTHMEIIAYCDPSGDPYDLGIDADAMVIWQNVRDGWEFTFETHSNVACPRQFVDPVIPTDRRPTPEPNPTVQYSVDQKGPDGREYRLDLRVLEPHQGSVILGYGERFYRSEIYYWPWQLVGCPDGHTCGTYQYDQANVWNCVGPSLTECFPIGDMRYGVEMMFDNESDPTTDIHVRYSGGAGKFRVSFIFSCDPDLNLNMVTFSDVGMQYPPTTGGTTVFVFAAVADMCPQNPNPSQTTPPPTQSIPPQTLKQTPSPTGSLPSSNSPLPTASVRPPSATPPPPPRRKTSGGPIFLIIVLLLAIGYFGIGAVIIYFTTGTVAVPNEPFWLEVWESIVTVVLFLFTCGGSARVTGPIYDRI
jgi:hypothetical protein